MAWEKPLTSLDVILTSIVTRIKGNAESRQGNQIDVHNLMPACRIKLQPVQFWHCNEKKGTMIKRFKLLLLTTLFTCAAIMHNAHADVTVLQELDFGEWIVTRNFGLQYVTVNTNGSYTNSTNMIMLSPPQPGVYTVDSLSVNDTIIMVSVTMLSPMSRGAGDIFEVDNFSVSHPPTTTPTGTATITLGARARASGNSQPYPDGTYNGTLQINFHF